MDAKVNPDYSLVGRKDGGISATLIRWIFFDQHTFSFWLKGSAASIKPVGRISDTSWRMKASKSKDLLWKLWAAGFKIVKQTTRHLRA